MTQTSPINNDVYAVHKWKPVTPAQFLEELGQRTLTVEEPLELKAEVTTLLDGRIRISYYAYARPLNFEGTGDDLTPYLLQLYEPESGKSVLLKRSDVLLNAQ